MYIDISDIIVLIQKILYKVYFVYYIEQFIF